MLQRTKYFAHNALKRVSGQRMICPTCGAAESDFVQRKYLVTELRKCRSCKLLFRYPYDTPTENFNFYQQEYRQGFATECPEDEALAALLEAGFVNSDRDYSTYLEIMKTVGVSKGATVIEFGASWGYGVWQLARAGFRAVGYEISLPRARYAREKLGVNVVDSISEIEHKADLFFSSHVLEHVPSIREVIALARKCVKRGGLFLALTPNGSEEFRARNPADFQRLWNRVHPNFLTEEFYQHLFADQPLLLGSSPYNLARIAEWNRRDKVTLPLDGIELLCVTAL